MLFLVWSFLELDFGDSRVFLFLNGLFLVLILLVMIALFWFLVSDFCCCALICSLGCVFYVDFGFMDGFILFLRILAPLFYENHLFIFL